SFFLESHLSLHSFFIYFSILFFSFNVAATIEIYSLSYTTLFRSQAQFHGDGAGEVPALVPLRDRAAELQVVDRGGVELRHLVERSEEHTSELQSRFDLVCRLLLEKKKRQIN